MANRVLVPALTAVLVSSCMASGGAGSDPESGQAEAAHVAAGTSNPQAAQGGLGSLTTAGAAAFNARFPAGIPTSACGNGAASANGIALFSIAGTSVRTNIFDISDPLLSLTALLFGGSANDG